MPPTSDGTLNSAYTASCAFMKGVPDETHRARIQDAVARVHACTFDATELLNLYVRDRLENHKGTGLENLFKQNWLLNAYYAVSTGRKAAKIDTSVLAVFNAHMATPTFESTDRAGLVQAFLYECINLAAVGSTNVWMHFRKRVLVYTRTAHALPGEAFAALTKDERRARKLALLQAADDLCRLPTEAKRSPVEYHAWVDQQRIHLGIDAAVGEWGDKPLLYHLKAKPHRFLKAMHAMSLAQHAAGRKAFALFPLRRSNVPRHVRFCQLALDKLLCLGHQQKKKKEKPIDLNREPGKRAPKRKRDDPSLLAEKMELFNEVLDLRAAGVHRRHHFAFAFTTDGVSLHLNMEKPKKENAKKAKAVKAFPMRGIHAIDALKAAAGKGVEPHVIGIDPGKRELVVAVDRDDPKSAPVVRYTLAQRRRDMRTRQYMDECKRAKPQPVAIVEEELSLHNSKAPSLAEFAAFAAARRALRAECPQLEVYYAEMAHRERRRKTKIKAQKSEAELINRLGKMHSKADARPLVLAYGSWGLVAGQANGVANKGNPPAIGVGLMKKLALHFAVSPTPEQYTSKTCVKCMGTCGPHPTLKTKNNKEIRGLRVCQNEGCGLLQNRDKTGATNIGLQFQRLFRGQGPIRGMTDEEREFHRLNLCLECDS